MKTNNFSIGEILYYITPDFSMQDTHSFAFNNFVKDNNGATWLGFFTKRRNAWKTKAMLSQKYNINFKVHVSVVDDQFVHQFYKTT